VTPGEAATAVKTDPRELVERLPTGKRVVMLYSFQGEGPGELSAAKDSVAIECENQSKSPDGWSLVWMLFDKSRPPA